MIFIGGLSSKGNFKKVSLHHSPGRMTLRSAGHSAQYGGKCLNAQSGNQSNQPKDNKKICTWSAPTNAEMYKYIILVCTQI